MPHSLGKLPSGELRRRAADYRLLARECAYPEGVDLLLLMADVHEDEATAAASAEQAVAAEPPVTIRA